MHATLPLDGFLTLLRARGYSVGLHEHLALARLLERWQGTSNPQFADAIAALIARNEEEVAGIKRLFEDVYTPPAPATAHEHREAKPHRPWRAYVWSLAIAAALVLALAAGWAYYGWLPPPPLPPPETQNPVVVTGPAAPTAITVPPPPAPAVPDPPERVDRTFAAQVFGAALCLALALTWATKTRRIKRSWVRDAWSTALANLPGPYHFNVVLRNRSIRLPRMDIEDAATILSRSIALDTLARELDVPRSIRLTLRRGLLPQLVYKPRRSVPLILVLQDISEDMRVWRDKVDAFFIDLARQGVPLERWYFDADIRRLSDRPRPGLVELETVLRRRPNAPVLVVSSGGGLDALPAGAEAEWVRLLESRNRRSWLTPVSDGRLWPEGLRALPLHVWPMTRRGLAQAARDLAGIDAEPSRQLRTQIVSEATVSADDIERMKRLVSLVPHPRPDLIEALRRRFAPDVSDAVVLHLFAESLGPSTAILRLPDEEIRRALAAMRRDTPRLEAAARQLLLDVLHESEPVAGSAAHERWQLAVALQELALADLDNRDASSTLQRLSELARGPIWEEVRRMARLTPATVARSRQVDAAIEAAQGRRREGPPEVPRGTVSPLPWSWPTVRELVPAAIVASVVFVVAFGFGLLPIRAISHVADAYNIEASAASAAAPGRIQVSVAAGAPASVPRRVAIYQNDTLFRDGVELSATGRVSVPLGPRDSGNYYQARALLRDGNLALSRPVWVPSDRLVPVLIDALPWANVSISGPSGAVAGQPTPFTAALEPGVYRLQFENGGVTPAMEQQITVGSPNQVFRFTMPGFDADRTANTLAGAAQTAR